MNKKEFLFLLIILTPLVLSCKNKTISVDKTCSEIHLHKSASLLHEQLIYENNLKQAAFSEYINNLSLQEKICQLFIENISGNTVFEPVERMDSFCPGDSSFVVPGGYLFFGFNLGDRPSQVINFTDSIVDYCSKKNKTAPYLSVDQEGGLVNRLKKLSGPFPSALTVGNNFSEDQAVSLFNLQARQMKLLGFNLNLAPVAEVYSDFNKDFLIDRSFGSKQKTVDFGSCFVKEFQKIKVGTVLKHFPGNSNTDPHTGLPEIKLSESELNKSLESFYKIMEENPSGILMSHARTSAIDSQVPACLSSVWVTQILRQQAGYKGLIFSDDIFMGALASNNYPPEKAVVMAVEAGIDCIMISEKRIGSAASVLYNKALQDKAFENKITESAERIIKFKLENQILQYTKNSDGTYSIQNYQNSTSVAEREVEFNNLRNQNCQLIELVLEK